MASVHICSYADMNYMFNVSSGVGRNRPNLKMDVMLVQYLLRSAMNKSAIVNNIQTSSHIAPAQYKWYDLEMDGQCGPMTQAFIDNYQQFRNSNKEYSEANKMMLDIQVKTDGAVDRWNYPTKPNLRFGNEQLVSASTLAALSYDFAKSPEARNMSEMPIELARILKAF